MSNKPIEYGLHTLAAVVCIVAMLILPMLYWILICLVGVMVNTSFKHSCGGFYYNNREKISVEIINMGPKR